MITRNCRKFFDRILILIHLLVTLFLKVALSTEKFTYFFLFISPLICFSQYSVFLLGWIHVHWILFVVAICYLYVAAGMPMVVKTPMKYICILGVVKFFKVLF